MNQSFGRSCALLLVLVAGYRDAQGCSYAEPPTFAQALKDARSVAVVRIESIRLQDPRVDGVVFTPDLVADVRVAEVLVGPKPSLKHIEFSSSWCAGHNLDVGAYYVVLVKGSSSTQRLVPDDPSIVYLFGEYDEVQGSAVSSSRLLMHFRNYKRLGAFPDAFPIAKYLEHNRVRSPAPPQ